MTCGRCSNEPPPPTRLAVDHDRQSNIIHPVGARPFGRLRSIVNGLGCRAIPCQTITMRRVNKREFSVVVERDEAGYGVASVPELPGCHTQARSLDKLIGHVREAIDLCLEVEEM